MKEKKITAYKGFDKDMKCRGYQYEVGKEYEMGGDVEVCKRGFHACENPMDVLNYYKDMFNDRYCVVEQSGDIHRDTDGTKIVSSKIKVKSEIGWEGLFKLGIEWLREITNPEKVKTIDTSFNDNGNYCAQIGSSGDCAQIGSSGDRAQIGSSGDCAQIGSSGDYAKVGSSGYYAQIGSSGDSAKIGSSGDSAKIGSSGYSAKIGSSGIYAQIGSSGNSAQIGSSGDSAKIGSSGDSAKISSTGKYSVIVCAGMNSIAKAKVGSWITLSEWKYSGAEGRCIPVCVKTEYVDGNRIKADTWYKLENGEFVEKSL